MAGIVVDSSIALSWCLPDEDAIDQIQRKWLSVALLYLCTGLSRLPTRF